MTVTMPLSGMICHPEAASCYDQALYHIWSLYLHSLWRYERWYKCTKWGSLGWL